MLFELDKEFRREEVRKEKRVARARKKMGVGSSQPSIKSKLRSGVPGVCVSEIAFRIGDSIEEVGGKIPKSFGTYLPQECSDTSLLDEIVPGGAVSKIAFRIGVSIDKVGGKIPKTFGAYLPQKCLETPIPARNGSPESPKNVKASGICQGESSINTVTGSKSYNVYDDQPVVARPEGAQGGGRAGELKIMVEEKVFAWTVRPGKAAWLIGLVRNLFLFPIQTQPRARRM